MQLKTGDVSENAEENQEIVQNSETDQTDQKRKVEDTLEVDPTAQPQKELGSSLKTL